MTDIIRAPWTPAQVATLNEFQRRGGVHPFTCGGDHAPGSPVLVAREDGWHCPQPYGEPCDYRQDWAHAFMADPLKWFGSFPHTSQSPDELREQAESDTVGLTRDEETEADAAWEQQDDGLWTLPIDGGTILFTHRTSHEERAAFAAAWKRADNPRTTPNNSPTSSAATEATDGLARQSGYLRDQFAVLAAQAPVPLPTAQELADGATADKVTAQWIHAARPGIPLHHIFNTLQALRAVRGLHRTPNPDREDRIPLDELTSDDLEQLYDDLDRYQEVVGELNAANTTMARDLAALREVARGYCPECGRGDAAPTVTDWEQQRQHSDRAGADLNRVTALYAQWVKAGPPPLGASMARWWDMRLAELHRALTGPAEQPARTTANNPATSSDTADNSPKEPTP